MARHDSTPRPLEIVSAAENTELRYEPAGEPERLELLPPMPEPEIDRLNHAFDPASASTASTWSGRPDYVDRRRGRKASTT